MTIAQALKQSWEKSTESTSNNLEGIKTPLEHYLKFNYNERYVKLCKRVEVDPVHFGQWLSRNVDTI